MSGFQLRGLGQVTLCRKARHIRAREAGLHSVVVLLSSADFYIINTKTGEARVSVGFLRLFALQLSRAAGSRMPAPGLESSEPVFHMQRGRGPGLQRAALSCHRLPLEPSQHMPHPVLRKTVKFAGYNRKG